MPTTSPQERTAAAPEAAGAPPFDFRAAAAALAVNSRFKDSEVEGLYALGRNFFEQGHYGRALHLLSTAALYRPTESRYMMALGICQKLLTHHDRAVQAFALVSLLEPDNPEPGLHVAECLLATGRRAQGLQLLETVLECVDLADGEHEAVGRRAEALLNLLERS
jgi:type III secretion system low calcium response chaperone LcrH/SycD